MKKRLLVVLAVLFIGTAAEVSALGVGVQFGANANGWGLTPSITLKLDAPWVFAVNGHIGGDVLGIGITADNWIMNPAIGKNLSWFWGWGLYGDIWLASKTGLDAGVRLPVGLRFCIPQMPEGNSGLSFEVYLQAAAQLGVGILPDVHFPQWGVPINLGFRVWF